MARRLVKTQRLPLELEVGYHKVKMDDHWWIVCSRRGDGTGIHLSAPMTPTSYNKMTFRDKRGRLNHWAIPASEKRKWGDYFSVLRTKLHKSYKPERRKLVRFTVFWPPKMKKYKNGETYQAKRTRLPDVTNVAAALKGALDQLKICGFIKEDNPLWVKEEYNVVRAVEYISELPEELNRIVVPGWTEVEIHDC